MRNNLQNHHFKSAYSQTPLFFRVFFLFMIGLSLIIIASVMAAVGYTAYQATQLDWSHGLQGVSEQIWYGKHASVLAQK